MLVTIKAFIKSVLRKQGFEISSSPTLAQFLKDRDITLLIDIGANTGQFAIEAREQGYNGRIISFEPIRSVYLELAARAAKDPLWDTNNMALGEFCGESVINVSENTVFSSMLPRSDLAERFDSSSSVARIERVEVSTLDTFLAENFREDRIFVKIDTQGFEKSVLKGSERSMSRILGFQLELSIEHLYQAAWNIEDAIRYMRERKFLPAQMRQVSRLQTDTVSAIEFDCVFRRIQKDSDIK